MLTAYLLCNQVAPQKTSTAIRVIKRKSPSKIHTCTRADGFVATELASVLIEVKFCGKSGVDDLCVSVVGADSGQMPRWRTN